MSAQNMKAVWISRFGGPDVLEIRDVEPPAGYPGEIPGMEFAGEVAEIGASVRLWKPGQRVFGLVAAAAHAEYLVTHERLLAEVPPNLDWAQAGSIPETFITAHD